MIAIQKSSTEQVQVDIREYKGKKYLDIRLWFNSSIDPEYRPTKKGISLPVALLPDLQKAIMSLEPETVTA